MIIIMFIDLEDEEWYLFSSIIISEVSTLVWVIYSSEGSYWGQSLDTMDR